jgi:hypothetical protein
MKFRNIANLTFFVAEKTIGEIKRRRILAMGTNKDWILYFGFRKKLLAIFQHNKMGFDIR